MDLLNDEQFMLRALELSKLALPHCRPNPPVGCVLVKNNRIVSEGFTQAPGQHHAEAQAIAQYNNSLEEVTAYVTLEPCSFVGRTPSCAHSLVGRNIKLLF
ncbi:bifunctional diaminohydroxyphosphoribosylaminopyrimidine deaminase/5-amino-6-(5-phosphoribosylamino)uracil reductase RibD [Moritella viscosa]